MSDPDDPRIGQVLQERYRVVSRLSAGAMGAVYRGERLQLGRPVAIKFLHEAFTRDPQFTKRFEVEARAMSRMGHPHVVSVMDFGMADVPYVVMEYVAGTTLRDLLEHGPLSAKRSLLILRQILAGLQHAHNNGVIHRDIKPANVMLTEATGTGDHVRLLDFGLAKLLTGSNDNSSTSPMAIGTPSYMAPEQARGESVDHRTDVYAAGVLLYELLTGRKPFESDEAFTIIKMQIDTPPPALAEKAPPGVRFSPELEALVARALAKKPEARWQSAAEMAAALEALPEAAHMQSRLPAELVPPALRDEDGADAGAAPPGWETHGDGGRGGADSRIDTRARGSGEGASRRTALMLALLLLVAVSAAALVLRDKRPWAARAGGGAPPAAADGDESAGADAEAGRSGELAERATGADATAEIVIQPEAADAAGDAADAGEALAGIDLDADLEADADEAEVTMDPEAAAEAEAIELAELDAGPAEAAAEAEAESPAAAEPAADTVDSVRDVERLLKEGKREAAYKGLIKLRRKYPKNAYIHYLLGNVQFEKLYYTDGLESYLLAVTHNATYKKNMKVNNNAIRALGVNKTRKKAEQLLLKNGRAALPYLDRAARGDKSKTVRARAAAVAKKLRRK